VGCGITLNMPPSWKMLNQPRRPSGETKLELASGTNKKPGCRAGSDLPDAEPGTTVVAQPSFLPFLVFLQISSQPSLPSWPPSSPSLLLSWFQPFGPVSCAKVTAVRERAKTAVKIIVRNFFIRVHHQVITNGSSGQLPGLPRIPNLEGVYV